MRSRPRRLRSVPLIDARQRGGASVPCPLCGAASRVVYTRRHVASRTGDTSYVYRLRVCEDGHKFPTNEEARTVHVQDSQRQD